jgi:hypothetical protein
VAGREVPAEPTEFRLSLLPDGDDEAQLWEVILEWWPRQDRWLVLAGTSWVVRRDGELTTRRLDREIFHSPEWQAEHLHEFGAAVELARRVLPTVTVNGVTAAQHHRNWIGWEAKRRAETRVE